MTDYFLHEKKYQEIKKLGWQGWGGNKRLSKGKDFIKTLFSYEETPKSGKALELGCGEGNISRLLSDKGFQVTGIDISKTAIEWAKEKNNSLNYRINFKNKDLSINQEISKEKFELIVDGNCLHCIIDQNRKVFLKNVYNNLAKFGVFFISSLCSKSDENEYQYLENKPYRFIPSKDYLINELEESNFVILKETIFERDKYNHINLHLKING